MDQIGGWKVTLYHMEMLPLTTRHHHTFINLFRIFLCRVRGKQSCLRRSCRRRRHTFGFRLITDEGMHQ